MSISQDDLDSFSNDLICKLKSLHIDTEKISEIMNYISEQSIFNIQNDVSKKTHRTRKTISISEQCNATRIDGNRCTRRKRTDLHYCGTHLNCTSYTEFNTMEPIRPIIDKSVSAIDIQGIIYYIDLDLNVYNTEDVLNDVVDPSIIGKASKNNGIYTIPSLGLN